MVSKIKIAIDCDGVILNWAQTYAEFVEDYFQVKASFPYSPLQYNGELRFPEDYERFYDSEPRKIFEEQGYWSKLQAMPDVDQLKEFFKNPLYDIYFVTHLPDHLKEARLQNLKDILGFEIPPEILITTSHSKLEAIQSLSPDFFIDDLVKNLTECHHPDMKSIWLNWKKEPIPDGYPIWEKSSLNDALGHIQDFAFSQNHPFLEEICHNIQHVVSDDLLTSQYREKSSALSHPTQGHCYASSEAVFHLIGGKASGYNSYCSSYKNEDGERETHWFLKKHHHIIDPTADQFTCLGKTPPYDIGKPIGFLTKAPSKRARIIMERLIAFKAELVPKVKF